MIEAPTVTREEINPSHPINVSQHRDVPQIIWANCGEPKNINGFTCMKASVIRPSAFANLFA